MLYKGVIRAEYGGFKKLNETLGILQSSSCTRNTKGTLLLVGGQCSWGLGWGG